MHLENQYSKFQVHAFCRETSMSHLLMVSLRWESCSLHTADRLPKVTFSKNWPSDSRIQFTISQRKSKIIPLFPIVTVCFGENSLVVVPEQVLICIYHADSAVTGRTECVQSIDCSRPLASPLLRHSTLSLSPPDFHWPACPVNQRNRTVLCWDRIQICIPQRKASMKGRLIGIKDTSVFSLLATNHCFFFFLRRR